MAVTADGLIVSGGEGLCVWDLTAADNPCQELGYRGCVTAVAVAPDGKVVVGDGGGNLWLFDLAAPNEPGRELGYRDSGIRGIVVHQGLVVSGHEDGGIWIWDLASPGSGWEIAHDAFGAQALMTTADGQLVLATFRGFTGFHLIHSRP